MSGFTEGFAMIQDIIKLKWIPEILVAIDTGSTRYSELLSIIPYLSHTELQRKLHVLMERGVVVKSCEIENCRYTLTPFGDDLVHIFRHFQDLSVRYRLGSMS